MTAKKNCKSRSRINLFSKQALHSLLYFSLTVLQHFSPQRWLMLAGQLDLFLAFTTPYTQCWPFWRSITCVQPGNTSHAFRGWSFITCTWEVDGWGWGGGGGGILGKLTELSNRLPSSTELFSNALPSSINFFTLWKWPPPSSCLGNYKYSSHKSYWTSPYTLSTERCLLFTAGSFNSNSRSLLLTYLLSRNWLKMTPQNQALRAAILHECQNYLGGGGGYNPRHPPPWYIWNSEDGRH